MIKTTCHHCRGEFPLNDTYKSEEIICCLNCLEQITNNKNTDEKEPQFKQQIDPTICFNCGFDNGHKELPRAINLPVCQNCEEYFQNRPFPSWIKASAVLLVAIVLFAMFYNFRFIKGYIDIRRAFAANENQNIEKTAVLMQSASKNVPEDRYVAALADYYTADYRASQGDYQDAITLLESCKNILEPEYMTATLIHYYQAYVHLEHQEFEKAIESLGYCNELPEHFFVEALKLYLKGLSLSHKENYTEAKKYFELSKETMPQGSMVEQNIIACDILILNEQKKFGQALDLLDRHKEQFSDSTLTEELVAYTEANIAFYEKDYDRLLQIAIQSRDKHSEDPMALAGVAGAYACKYATTGNEEFKTKAIDQLRRAQEMGGNLDSFQEYKQRILHRIDTKEIIDSDEFRKRFPDGWQSEQESQE